MEFEGKLPPVSEESDLDLKEGDVVRNISVNIRFQDGWTNNKQAKASEPAAVFRYRF